jgi:streptogramin lyase
MRFTVATVKATATFASVAAMALLGAPPALAGEAVHVRLGSSLSELIVGPDGGAWVSVDRGRRDGAIGRAQPDGRFRTTATSESVFEGALGPDGNAWYQVDGAEFLRSDANGEVIERGEEDYDDPFGPTFATGPDGTLWSPTPKQDGFWHVTPDGKATKAPGGLPKPCRDGMILTDMARASDGAMWLSDEGCERLIRVSPAGTTTITLQEDPDQLAADASGGMWVSGGLGSATVRHADATGNLTSADLPDDLFSARDIAVAPDGSAWLAFAECRLVRVSPAGGVTTAPAPVPAAELGFDPAGGMWLASAARLVHVAPGEGFGRCDDRPPAVRLGPGRDGGTVSLKRLRRRGGLTVKLREPVAATAFAVYYDDEGATADIGDTTARIFRGPRGGTIRYRVPAKRLRRFARDLAAGRKPFLSFAAFAQDVEGNPGFDSLAVRIRP